MTTKTKTQVLFGALDQNAALLAANPGRSMETMKFYGKIANTEYAINI